MGKRPKRRAPPVEGTTPAPIPPVRAAASLSLVGGLAVCALVAGVYGRSVTFDFTHTDDTVLLKDDARFISNVGNLPRTLARPFFPRSGRSEGYFRPLVTASFFLDARWNGIEPAAFVAPGDPDIVSLH